MKRIHETAVKLLCFITVLTFLLPTASAFAYNEQAFIPFSDEMVVEINDNIPDFKETDITNSSYTLSAELDDLGRTGCGQACLGPETITDEPRGEIGEVKPSGWHTISYNDLIEDRYLYNRCHVIAHMLSGLNSEPRNLFTGTRQLNLAMLDYEIPVDDYIEDTGNHVLYRVTPIYAGDNDLVAYGVQMEAFSVEDNGKGICYNVWIYNRQDGIVIDYQTGESWREQQSNSQAISREANTSTSKEPTYVLNINTFRFHETWCDSCDEMNPKNKRLFYGTRDEAIEKGYVPCGNCRP